MANNAKLTAKTRAWMAQIEMDYTLTSAETEILRLAAQLLDRVNEARQAVAKDGPFLRSSRGALCPHPGLRTEVDAARAFAALAAAESAWRQFGPKVMERWNRGHHPAGDRELPEAFIRFGDPGKLR